MKIALEDADIDRIASAVAAKVGKGGGTGGKKPAAEAEAEAEADTTETETDFEGEGGEGDGGEASEVDRDTVLASLKSVTDKFTQAEAMAILKKVGGVAKLSLLDDDKFQAVIDGCNKKLKTKK